MADFFVKAQLSQPSKEKEKAQGPVPSGAAARIRSSARGKPPPPLPCPRRRPQLVRLRAARAPPALARTGEGARRMGLPRLPGTLLLGGPRPPLLACWQAIGERGR
jgi:hypothetical protein